MKRQDELDYPNQSNRREGYRSSTAGNPLRDYLGSLTHVGQITLNGTNVWKGMSKSTSQKPVDRWRQDDRSRFG
jgi:hypothetical protein